MVWLTVGHQVPGACHEIPRGTRKLGEFGDSVFLVLLGGVGLVWRKELGLSPEISRGLTVWTGLSRQEHKSSQQRTSQLIPAHFSPFQRISARFSPFQPISAHFSPFQPISAHFSPFQPISAHFSPLQPISLITAQRTDNSRLTLSASLEHNMTLDDIG